MIKYILQRLLTLVPSVFGISMVTFILINLAAQNPGTLASHASSGTIDQETAYELGRTYGANLPLFVNFSILDIKSYTSTNIEKLSIKSEQNTAMRSLINMGGAVIPYLLDSLDQMDKKTQEATLVVLEGIAPNINVKSELQVAENKLTFWQNYTQIYVSDFTPNRARQLTRRYVRRNDQLALAELKRLGTFSLPQLMETLDTNISQEGFYRIISLAEELTGRIDPYDLDASPLEQEEILSRWKEWWNQRSDLYTSIEGFDRLTSTITQTRYFGWLARVFTFDFGVSSRDGRPIKNKISELLPVTLLLSFLALIVAYIIAIPIGILAAVKRDSIFDKTVGIITFILYSLPSFWVAMLLLKYIGSTGYLDWFPSQGLRSEELSATASWWALAKDTAHHLVLPVLCLSMVSIAMLTRYQRAGMLQINEQGYIRTARAKGLSEFHIVLRHGLRNGILPIVTLMGFQLPYLISSSVVIEKIFGIQGMGAETFEAIRTSDYSWLLAVITVTAVLTLLGILISNVIYALIDPRIMPGLSQGRRA